MADDFETSKIGTAKRIEELEREIKRLTEWVNDLQAGMYVNCVYCGHRYGPESEVSTSMADVLKEHIAQCKFHPMAKMKKALEDLIALKQYKDWRGKTPEYLEKRPLAWQQARDALELF